MPMAVQVEDLAQAMDKRFQTANSGVTFSTAGGSGVAIRGPTVGDVTT